MRQIGVEVNMKQVDTPLWSSAMTRKDDQAGANVAGFGLDDPDYFIRRPYVHGFVPHHGIDDWGRLTDVWIDRRWGLERSRRTDGILRSS